MAIRVSKFPGYRRPFGFVAEPSSVITAWFASRAITAPSWRVALWWRPTGDRMADAHAMVTLVAQGLAQQNEVARAFGCSARTVRRHERCFDE